MPASGRVLLDTNIVIALLEGDETVLFNLEQAVEVFVPAIVLGELFFGAAKSGRPSENAARVERFAAAASVLSCDVHVAREYGPVKHRLREKGRPLPENAVWVVAAAKRHALMLITPDSHFDEVERSADCRMVRPRSPSALAIETCQGNAGFPAKWLPGEEVAGGSPTEGQ